MKKITVLAACLLLSTASFAGSKSKCKKKYTEVSCSKIEDAKREHFCWKGKLSEKKKTKICTTEKKKRKHKKMVKKRS